jgi:isoquinoline 1-oxidoreductase
MKRALLPQRSCALPELNRRDMLKLLGTGIVVGIWGAPQTANAEQLPNNFLRIAPDGTITILTSKVELGQGVKTAFAQIAAEELDAPLENIRVVGGDTALCSPDPGGQETWGSLSISQYGARLRDAAARARMLLLKVAAQQLGLPETQLSTSGGFVVDTLAPATRVSYGTLAGGGTANLAVTARPKDPTTYTICGQPAVRLDAIEKVTGQARYAADIRLPGLLYARLVRAPFAGGTFKSPPDTTEAEKIPGVQIVRLGSNLVAVLHELPDVAAKALTLVRAEFNPPAIGPTEQTIHEFILSRPPSQIGTWSGGNLNQGRAAATAKRELTYQTPYVAHASMETHAAVASFENGKVTVWASTQAPYQVRQAVASAVSLSTANVQVISPAVGGAFGGKISSHGHAIEAARLSKAVGKPVNVTWTREEEFLLNYYQPPCVVAIDAGLDAAGQVAYWDSRSYFTGNGSMTRVYDFANHRTVFLGSSNARESLPLSVGAWRGPGDSFLTFARESHMDVLAAAAHADPVEFRLRHLRSARVRNVLTTAAEAFGWKPLRSPGGGGFGVALGEWNNAFVVIMAQVAVDLKTGRIQVLRMLSALDVGRVVNPDGLRQQMESGIMMGLGYSLSEELHFNGANITDLNFDKYRIPQFSTMPKIETVIVRNDSLAPIGAGEPPVVAVGGAVANAFFDATGLRAPRIPLTSARVLDLLRTAPAPDLNPPECADGQLRLSWVNRPGLILQKAASLDNPVWETVSLAEGQCSAALPMEAAKAFFRLVKAP